MQTQHEIEFRVRYQETDAQGWVHHANYLGWFEMGRCELLRTRGLSYRDLEDRGVLLVVSELSCRYLLPARFDDWLRLRTTASRDTWVRLEHLYELWRGDELLADGRTVLVCVDRAGKPQKLPPELRSHARLPRAEGERSASKPHSTAPPRKR